MRAKIIYAIKWDDRLTLLASILIVLVFWCKNAPGLAIAFGAYSTLLHVVLLTLSRSIDKVEEKK